MLVGLRAPGLARVCEMARRLGSLGGHQHQPHFGSADVRRVAERVSSCRGLRHDRGQSVSKDEGSYCRCSLLERLDGPYLAVADPLGDLVVRSVVVDPVDVA